MADTLSRTAAPSAAISATSAQLGAHSTAFARRHAHSATFAHIDVDADGTLSTGPALAMRADDWEDAGGDIVEALLRTRKRYVETFGRQPTALLVCSGAEAALVAHPRTASLVPRVCARGPQSGELKALFNVGLVVVGDGDLRSQYAAALMQAACATLSHQLELERGRLCRLIDNLRTTMTAFHTVAEHDHAGTTDWPGLFEVLAQLCPPPEVVDPDALGAMIRGFSGRVVRAVADAELPALASPAFHPAAGHWVTKAIQLAGMGSAADAAEHSATAEALATLAAADTSLAPALQAFTRLAPVQRAAAARPARAPRRTTAAAPTAAAA